MPASKPESNLPVLRSNDQAALTELQDIIMGGDFNVEVIDDPEMISKQILADIFAADSVDELERKPAEGWRDLAGIPMEIHSFTARASTMENSSFYFVVRATDVVNGEDHVLTTGSLNVCAQLVKLAQLGHIPGAVRILQEEKTKDGQRSVLYLVSTPQELERRRDARIAARQGATE